MATQGAKQPEENGKQKALKKSSTSVSSSAQKPPASSNEKLQLKVDGIIKESIDSFSAKMLKHNVSEKEKDSAYEKAHEDYVMKLNEVYSEKEGKVKEVNEKFDYDLYKAKEFYDVKNSDSVSSRLYNSVLADKNAELKLIQDEFNEKMGFIKKEYDDTIAQLHKKAQESIEDINQVECFEELKGKINAMIEALSEAKSKKENSSSGANSKEAKVETKPAKAKKEK